MNKLSWGKILYIGGAVLCGLLFFLSCLPKTDSISIADGPVYESGVGDVHQAAGEANDGAADDAAPGDPRMGRPILLKTGARAGVELIAATHGTGCEAKQAGWTWSIPLNSPFGVAAVAVTFVADFSEATARIDDSETKITLSQDARAQVRQLCQDASVTKAPTLAGSADLAAETGRWLSAVSPDCHPIPSAKGWTCQMPIINSSTAERDLERIHENIANRWSRQPYLLTRRIAIAKELAAALSAPSSQLVPALERLCKVVSFSYQSELPLAMAVPRWRDIVCGAGADDLSLRSEAASVGLAKAWAEIGYLKELAERTSKLGSLSLLIDHRLIPAKDILISLTPLKTDIDELADGRLSESGGGACWHPLFHGDRRVLALARVMGLTGSAKDLRCTTDANRAVASANDGGTRKVRDDEAAFTEKYLSSAITSDTEFVLANGKSKVLRLPAGKYKYSLRDAASLTDESGETSYAESSGEIEWTAKRPIATIRTW